MALSHKNTFFSLSARRRSYKSTLLLQQVYTLPFIIVTSSLSNLQSRNTGLTCPVSSLLSRSRRAHALPLISPCLRRSSQPRRQHCLLRHQENLHAQVCTNCQPAFALFGKCLRKTEDPPPTHTCRQYSFTSSLDFYLL